MPTLKATYSHKQWSDRVRPAVPCSCHHITFGGVCLNCGYDPEGLKIVLASHTKKVQTRVSEYRKEKQQL